MRIKVFIVTYRNEYHLNCNLATLMNSDLMAHQWEVTVINNHSDFNLHEEFKSKVRVFNNVVRPDWSTGHLARDWNCGILHGFKDLLNPDADIVVLCQEDTIFTPDWCRKIIDLHKRYSFIQYGWGDCFMSFTVEAVRRIGLWDERFGNLGQQEADYFLRAYIYNREKSSINDEVHVRWLNPERVHVITRPEHPKSEHHLASTVPYNTYSNAVYMAKWGFPSQVWTPQLLARVPKHPLIPSFITYPYFEKDIYELDAKGYCLQR